MNTALVMKNGLRTIVSKELKNLFAPSELKFLHYWLANKYAMGILDRNRRE